MASADTLRRLLGPALAAALIGTAFAGRDARVGAAEAARAACPRPSARSDMAMTYDEARHMALVFGGSRAGGRATDARLWGWDGAAWTRQPGTGPDPRGDPILVFQASSGRVLLYGGVLND